jgi:hypothetical protein
VVRAVRGFQELNNVVFYVLQGYFLRDRVERLVLNVWQRRELFQRYFLSRHIRPMYYIYCGLLLI